MSIFTRIFCKPCATSTYISLDSSIDKYPLNSLTKSMIIITELTIETSAPDRVGSVKSEGSFLYISKLFRRVFTPYPNILAAVGEEN